MVLRKILGYCILVLPLVFGYVFLWFVGGLELALVIFGLNAIFLSIYLICQKYGHDLIKGK